MRALWLAVLLLAAALPFGPPAAARAEGSAGLEYTWDFGAVTAGARVSHPFRITNEGTKTLRITGTYASCGCTASKVSKEELLPGESADVAVTFDSSGYHGQARQFVYVNTDDPERPVIRLIITASVK